MDWEAIWNRARTDLTVVTDRGDADLFLFEHSARVSQTAQRIAAIPAVRSQAPDEAALVAAALYHEAGWVVRLREGRSRRDEILVRPLAEADREEGARMAERSLKSLLSAESLRKAARALRSLGDREIESVEGRIVSDADNLLEFGLLSLWMTVRRGAFEGRGVKAAIDTWRRRKEYHFWDARLKDAFNFADVRTIAERRLASLEGFMQELEAEDAGADLGLGEPGSREVASAKATEE